MFKRRPAFWLAIGLTALFLILAVIQPAFMESLELTAYDFRMRLRAGGPDTQTDIALIEIDNDSITKMGRWPWPRSVIAGMIDKLNSAGASFIGLNIIFSEPETPESLKMISSLSQDFAQSFNIHQDPAARTFYQKLRAAQRQLDSDTRLARSLSTADKVILPIFFKIGQYGVKDPQLPESVAKNGLVHIQGQALDMMLPANQITAPIPPFAQPAAGLGHINMAQDLDGAIRRELLLIDYKGLVFPSFALKTVLLAQGLYGDQVHVNTGQNGPEGVKIGKTFVPTSRYLSFYITYTDEAAFPRFSFFDVFNDKVQASAFKGKIVLIGITATGIDAPRVTPVDKAMSTTALSANVIHNLLTGGFIVRGWLMFVVELALILVVGAFLALLLPKLGARAGALSSLGVLVVLIAAGVILFVGPGLWLKVAYPVLLTVLGYAAVTTSGYFITEKGRAKAEGESAEVNRMLGLSFQNQGQLDMAFDKFRRVPVDEGMKDILYNLGLDYERKRMYNKAVSVYEYIKQYDAQYKDIDKKIKKLTAASETMVYGLGTAKQADDGTLMVDADAKPTLGRYEIIKELGKGAMGIVYLGKDPQIGREMAIKTIRFTDEYEADEAERIKDQFFAEAKTAGMLSHPNIVTIYDAGTDHDLSFIAMEYLQGYDLKEHAREDNLLSIREVIGLIADVADALGYAHGKGVVHRDIKPANIMYLDNKQPKVTDFGIARAMASSKTKTGVVKGTPFYMSPEQITGKKVDGRSDIFSLGVVLYELLTGVQPFRADDLTGLIYKITADDPEDITAFRPKIPKAVIQILDRALTKDRDKRYQKAEQMAEHLRIVARKMDELAGKKPSA
jgi:serine/threonine-protein kinase